MSPVKCKFISSIGAIWLYPPPVAPPLIPNTGPKDGSLNAKIAFLPILLNPSANPIDIVVLPSPNGVGLIAVTNISLPFCFSCSFLYTFGEILALYFPYCSRFSSSIPNFIAILVTGSNFAFLAISISSIIASYKKFVTMGTFLFVTFCHSGDTPWIKGMSLKWQFVTKRNVPIVTNLK